MPFQELIKTTPKGDKFLGKAFFIIRWVFMETTEQRESFVSYRSFHEALKGLELEQYGRVMFAINEYALYGNEIELEGIEKMCFILIKPQLDANIKRQDNGKYGILGGRPKKIDNLKDKKIETNENPMGFFSEENKNPNVNDNDNVNLNVNDNANLNSAEPSEKPTLAEREPKNDIEQVEKAYLLNYGSLYKLGILKSEKPIINWGQSRKLTRSAIDSYGLENILLAIERSKDSEFCIKKGYSLSTILSAGVLAGLINGGEQYVKKKSALADFESPPDIMDDVIF